MIDIVGDIGQAVPGPVLSLHNNIMKALIKYYPKWKDHWRVRIDTHNGCVWIWNEFFSGTRGYMMHIAKIDPEMRRVVKNAGELLERYNVSRSPMQKLEDAIRDLKRTGIGEGVYQ